MIGDKDSARIIQDAGIILNNVARMVGNASPPFGLMIQFARAGVEGSAAIEFAAVDRHLTGHSAVTRRPPTIEDIGNHLRSKVRRPPTE